MKKYKITTAEKHERVQTESIHLCFGQTVKLDFDENGEAIAELNDVNVKYLTEHGYIVEEISESND